MILLRCAIALTLGAIAGCGGGGGESSSVTDEPKGSPTADGQVITGHLDLLFSGSNPSGLACSGASLDGYDDIIPGAEVIVKDETGTIIASSSLRPGESTPAVGYQSATYCRFPFTVDDVPRADFYTIEVSHRGELTYSYAELSGDNWEVNFTLGR